MKERKVSNVIPMESRTLTEFNLTKSIGEFGLVKPKAGFTQEQLDEVGELLGRVDNAGAWNRGDWYNEQEKGVGGRPSETVPNLGIVSLSSKCEQYFHKSQKHLIAEAEAAARFPDYDTRRKLTFSHFAVLLDLEKKHPGKFNTDQFIQMAYIGDRYPGEFSETQKYRKQPWTAAQLKRAILIEIHELTDTHVKEVDKAESDAMSGITRILEEANIGVRIRKRVIKEVECELKAAFSELRCQFKDQVMKAASTERKELEQERKRLAKERARYETSLTTIPSQMTSSEFKLILGCLHPDKCDPDSRERYAKAFDLFNSLRENNKLG